MNRSSFILHVLLRQNLLKGNYTKLTNCGLCSYLQHEYFSTSSRNNNLNKHPSQPSGFVLHIANPINILRNWWTQAKIQWNFDPEFSYPTFLVGAKQGASVFSHLLSQKDYIGMRGLVNDKTIRQMKEKTTSWTEEQCLSVTFEPEDINFAKPRVSRYINIEGIHYLDIDVFLVAIKVMDKPLLIELTMRFSREFSTDHNTDWTIARVGHLNVKEFQTMKLKD